MRHKKFIAVTLMNLFTGIASFGSDPIRLPNGLTITPDAVPRSVLFSLNPHMPGRKDVSMGEAVTTALSPDGQTLLVLTSGYNMEGQEKFREYVFIFDVGSYPPRQVDALPIPNSFCGLAWNPNGLEFYVSGGVDDRMYIFAKAANGKFSRTAAISLGHSRGNGLYSNASAPLNAEAPKPMVAGIAVNQAGKIAVVANFYNDSISIIDIGSRRKTGELDLRPGVQDRTKTGVPGGEYPYWIAIRGNEKAYISSPRDREIVIVGLEPTLSIHGRIALPGQPNRILLNQAQNRMFVALDNADAVAIIDIDTNRVMTTINVAAPPAITQGIRFPKGANPNSLSLSPDEKTLYVTDGGTNAVAFVTLEPGSEAVIGLVPTGWYPNSVSASSDGKYLYVVNGKSVPGPNPGNCRSDVDAPGIPDCDKTPNQYVYSLEKASLLSLPVPLPSQLEALTKRVVENNRFDYVRSASVDPLMTELRRRIQHVIYVIKENRTYDQVLGDLEVGDGDPSLTEFPEPLTPNHHSIARRFVTLDNFLDSGEVSGVGWNWTTAARTTDYTEKTVPPNYAGRGFVYDWEGTNRNVNVGIGSVSKRVEAQPMLRPSPDVSADPNLLPGDADVAAPDAVSGEAGAGYLWDEALAQGLTLRNYGVFCDLTRYENPQRNRGYIRISKNPFEDKIVQAVPTKKALLDHTDPYFRSFDQNNSDFYLYKEWEREFDQFVSNKNLPNLSLVRLPHDHFGNFGTALYGINTPGLQMADNDYALGLLIQKVAGSPYAGSTLIFVIEDDAQDGPDHVDAHRSIAFVAGPYVKQGAVVSERYTTVNMVRTIESLLGIAPNSLFSAAATPMTEIFDLTQSTWDYKAIVPDLLRTSQLPLPARTADNSLPQTNRARLYAKDTHTASYWQRKLGDMDYNEEDKLDTPRFNRELWIGMMGRRPYPQVRSGRNLRENRSALLQQFGILDNGRTR